MQDAIAMARPINRHLMDYWTALLDGAALPTKSVFDPTRIPDALPHLLIYERLGADRYKIRLTGTVVDQRVGISETGDDPFDRVDIRGREQVRIDFGRILSEPCGQLITVRDTYSSGRSSDVEVVRLPLLDEQGDARFIISSTEVIGPKLVIRAGEEIVSLALPIQSRYISLA